MWGSVIHSACLGELINLGAVSHWQDILKEFSYKEDETVHVN